MIKDLIPLNDKILVKRFVKENKTDSGIFLAEVTEEISQWATVVSVGAGRLLPSGEKLPLVIKPGWVVYCNKFTVQQDIDGYMIIREDDVLGYIEG